MGETVTAHDLGSDVDENGNLLTELANGMTLEEAVWKIGKEQQSRASRYIELNQKIDELPDFEKNVIRGTIMEYLSNEMSAQGESYRDYGIVQYFSGSSKPLSYWGECSFNTNDGKFENYLDNKIRPAVEGMIEDLKGDRA